MQQLTLGEICRKNKGLIQTGPFGSQLHQSDYCETGIPVVMPKDIKNGRVSLDSIARISETKANELSRHLLPINAILIPRRGDINKRAFIQEEQAGFLCGTGCIQIVLPQKLLNPRFFYYFLSQRKVVEWLEKNAIGTTMLNLSATILSELPVPILQFPVDKQKRIADILSKYDDLIENNRRRIELLEESARLLYREWFVYLRFPGHEHIPIVDGIPEGWEEKTLGEVGYLNYGKALKENARIPGEYSVYGSSGVIGTHNKFLVEAPGIIVGRKGSIGSVFWSSDNYYPIDTTYFIKSDFSSLYLYHVLLNNKFMNTDAAVPGLNRDFAHSMKVLISNHKYFDLFNDFVQPVYSQISQLKKYNNRLQQARDLLLPRLMNGEITV